MRNKKNRKCLRDASPAMLALSIVPTELIKFKFNLSKDNISCFMSKNRLSKRVCRKTSQSSAKSHANQSKPKAIKGKKNQIGQNQASVPSRQQSPDIVRELSNTIISKIESEGILCAWNDNEESRECEDAQENTSLWSAFDNTSVKSFASTNDYPHYRSMNLAWNLQQPESEVYISPVICSFLVQPEMIQYDWRTTLMVRNIPNKYTVNELAEEINSEHANTYDFLYLPCDPKNNCNVGYSFINFVDTKYLRSFYLKYDKYIWQKYKSEKICALTYARLQGLNQLIEHFQNSKVLNQKQKKYRPIIKLDKIHKMVMEQQAR